MATITSPRPSSPAVPSGTNTPTSSTRLSSDLPRINTIQHNPGTTTANPPPQRRNRAALRDYYNLKSKQTASAAATADGANSPIISTSSPSTSTQALPYNIPLSRTASITSTTSNSTSTTTTQTHDASSSSTTALPSLSQQLDDPTFNADTYISTLLRTSSLRDIFRTESSLVSEIRNLDGERKALVYDNYSKLIKAVGTIGEMQRGMEKGSTDTGLHGVKDLERRLDGLIEGLGVVVASTATASVHQDGNRNGNKGDDDNEMVGGGGRTIITGTRRTRTEERKKKDLVRWALDAPDRLQRLDRETARKEWDEVRELLDRWEGVKGVDEVRLACQRVMKGEENDSDRATDDEDGDVVDKDKEENDND